MHIHILGICGTFMGSLAILAKQLGFQVSGCDANVYPPMSTQLREQGITLLEGYDPVHLSPEPDLVVIGNALSRGNPMVEHVLDVGLAYTCGPQWLQEQVLARKWVLAVAGTHGKTTTSSMLAWILEFAGLQPGFLIGGVPTNFAVSARLGGGSFFVVEADEYDSAFFDKRSKFVHYRPRTAILNNLEFDHADIFPDLEAIQRQFHHLLRTVPASGLIIHPFHDDALAEVIDMGCWSATESFSVRDETLPSHWQARLLASDGSIFKVLRRNDEDDYGVEGEVHWRQSGDHNVSNALAAIAAARVVGVTPAIAIEALGEFKGVKRRMEELAIINGITIYDDFAHHPTAIATTLEGLRKRVGQGRIIAIIEPRSNTMRMGLHKDLLAPATQCVDEVYWFQPAGMNWDLQSVVEQSAVRAAVYESTGSIIEKVVREARADDHVVIMSNGGFEGIHRALTKALDFSGNYE